MNSAWCLSANRHSLDNAQSGHTVNFLHENSAVASLPLTVTPTHAHSSQILVH